MPHIRSVAGDLLEYNSDYSLLICRQCQYAIQKSALESHLLRHKIYRSARKRLLSSIAQLHLLEPQHVILPAPGSPPVDALPILSGYRCTAAACQHLTVSSKCMRRHWSEIHQHDGSVPLPSSFARPVKLQTFFRGTKVRYFEVVSPTAPLINADDGGDDDVDSRKDHHEESEDEGPDAITTTQPSPPRVPAPPGMTHDASSTDFNLETLTYFHIFSTMSCLTLPGDKDPQSGKHYWQMHIISQALRRHWLMCGLLAISTYHSAALTDDIMTKRIDLARGEQLTSKFIAGLEQSTGCDLGREAAEVEKEVKRTGEQIRCLLRCAQWALADSTFHDDSVPSHQLLSIMATIRGCVLPDSSLRSNGIWNDSPGLQEQSSTQALRNASHLLPPHTNSPNDNTPSALLDLLHTLPYRMAEAFGRPASAEDIFSTLSAITTIAQCCEISFSSDETGAAWHGVATWLARVPDHFNQMVGRDDPAALVVVAHWALILVKRAERVGCWVLKGLAKVVVMLIQRILSVQGHAAVLHLVENLMDMVSA